MAKPNVEGFFQNGLCITIQDVHYFLDQWAQHKSYAVTILSLDTAVSVSYGDLHHGSVSWSHLISCYQRGWISATIVEPPCETFSEARYQQPDKPDTNWPRPLRSFQRLFGLPSLTNRELRPASHRNKFLFARCSGDLLAASSWRISDIGAPGATKRCQSSLHMDVCDSYLPPASPRHQAPYVGTVAVGRISA